MQGTSVYGLVKVAESLGFTAKGVKASKAEDIFGEFPKPAIAYKEVSVRATKVSSGVLENTTNLNIKLAFILKV